jgi:hypothetical protein
MKRDNQISHELHKQDTADRAAQESLAVTAHGPALKSSK